MEKNNVVLIQEIRGDYSIHQRDIKKRTPVRDRMHIYSIILILIDARLICAENVVTLIDSTMHAQLPNLPVGFSTNLDLLEEEISLLSKMRNLKETNKYTVELANMKGLPKFLWDDDFDDNLYGIIYFTSMDVTDNEHFGQTYYSIPLFSKEQAKGWLKDEANKVGIDIMDVIRLTEEIDNSKLKEFEESYVVEFTTNPDLSCDLLYKN
ncbi:MAG: hypothetical protein RL687_496 [Candidatus Parcubacteria bacterium]|jgi:hypothetical protein